MVASLVASAVPTHLRRRREPTMKRMKLETYRVLLALGALASLALALEAGRRWV